MRRVFYFLIALHAGTAVQLAPSWHDNVSLWSRVLAVSPTHAMAALSLGSAYARDRNDALRGEVYLETARALATAPHVSRLERTYVIGMADQDLVILAENRHPPNAKLAGELLKEAYELWPESFERPLSIGAAPSLGVVAR